MVTPSDTDWSTLPVAGLSAYSRPLLSGTQIAPPPIDGDPCAPAGPRHKILICLLATSVDTAVRPVSVHGS